MSTYLLAYLGTGTFRYLPYIYFSPDGDIIVREYGPGTRPSPAVAQSNSGSLAVITAKLQATNLERSGRLWLSQEIGRD